MLYTKRSCDWDKVDFGFLVEQRRILTRAEYESKKLQEAYDYYVAEYYKRRLMDIFEVYKSMPWFIDRYLSERRVTRDPTTTRYMVIEDYTDKARVDEVLARFKDIEGFTEVYIVQKGVRGYFRKDIYLNMSDQCDSEGLLASIDEHYQAYVLDIAGIKIKEYNVISLNQAKAVYAELCRLNNIDGSAMAEEASLDVILHELRRKFLYCTVCCRQYDAVPEMYKSCEFHTAESFSARTVEILGARHDFSTTKCFDENSEINKLIIKTPDEAFKCKECQKLFTGLEFVRNHIKAKHSQIIDDIQLKRLDFERFINNMDVFMLEMIEGTSDRRIPPWGRSFATDGVIVYDMPHLFSGEITL